MSPKCKGVLDSNFNEAVIDKILIFKKLPQDPHTHKNRIYLKIIIGKRLTNFFFFLPYKYYGTDIKESSSI